MRKKNKKKVKQQLDLKDEETKFDREIISGLNDIITTNNSRKAQKVSSLISENCVKDEFLGKLVTDFLDERFMKSFNKCDHF